MAAPLTEPKGSDTHDGSDLCYVPADDVGGLDRDYYVDEFRGASCRLPNGRIRPKQRVSISYTYGMRRVDRIEVTPDGKIEVINAGIGGTSTNNRLKNYPKEVLAHKPELRRL